MGAAVHAVGRPGLPLHYLALREQQDTGIQRVDAPHGVRQTSWKKLLYCRAS